MAAGPDRPRGRLTDPGAQLERTSLAWSRTAVAMAACGALIVRQGLLDHAAVLVGFGCLALGVSAAGWLLAAVRYTRKQAAGTQHLLMGHRYAVRAVTALTALLSCVAAVTAVLAVA